MKYIELLSPIKRKNTLSLKDYKIQIGQKAYLPKPKTIKKDFINVISNRYSERIFTKINSNDLSSILWYSSKSLKYQKKNAEIVWEHRYVPSAGGIHSLLTFVIKDKKEFSLYDSYSHALCIVPNINEKYLAQLIRKIDSIIPSDKATYLIYAVNVNKIYSRYKNPESLVYRDCGCIIMSDYLIASAINISCCAIGITCEPYFSSILNSNQKIIGVGGVVVG